MAPSRAVSYTHLDVYKRQLYLVLDRQYPLEEVLRATLNIEKEYNWNFDGGKGYINLGSQLLNIIRLRHLSEIDMVVKIQEAYIKQNIGFLMNKKIHGKLEAEVKIVKFMAVSYTHLDVYKRQVQLKLPKSE